MDKKVNWKLTLKEWQFSKKDTTVIDDPILVKQIAELLTYAGENLLEQKIEFFENNFSPDFTGSIEDFDKNRVLIEAGEQLSEHNSIAETNSKRKQWGISTFEMPLVYEDNQFIVYFKFQFENKNDKTLKNHNYLKRIWVRIHKSKLNLGVLYENS